MFLPALPAQAAKILRDHNEDTLKVFTTYAKTFVDQHIKADDNKLPLTGMMAGGSDDRTSPGSLPACKVRSSFVALSGHGDHFKSIPDLCRTTRSGIFLEEAVIPHLDVYPDESKAPLNACMYHSKISDAITNNQFALSQICMIFTCTETSSRLKQPMESRDLTSGFYSMVRISRNIEPTLSTG